MATFVEIMEYDCDKERHPMSKAIFDQYCKKWKTVRDRMSVSIIN